MRTTIIIAICMLIGCTEERYEYDYENILTFDMRLAIAENRPINAHHLVKLCYGRESRVFCEGYMSALATELGILENPACGRAIDLSSFIHEGIWTQTIYWLQAQPEDFEISLNDAIRSALSDQDGCESW